MSYTYLQEQGEESLADNFSGIPQSVLSKSKSMQDRSYSNDNETECCQDSQFGTTLRPSTASLGVDLSTWWLEDFPAKTSAAQVKVLASQANGLGFGLKCTEWFAKYDPDSCSWKTAQCSLFEDLTSFSVTWPKAGTMQNGVC